MHQTALCWRSNDAPASNIVFNSTTFQKDWRCVFSTAVNLCGLQVCELFHLVWEASHRWKGWKPETAWQALCAVVVAAEMKAELMMSSVALQSCGTPDRPSSQTAASVRGTFVPYLTEEETWCGLALQACCCSFCCRYSASATVACTANSLFPDNEQPHPVTSCLLLSSIVSSYFVPEKNDQPGQRRGPRFLHEPVLLYLWGQHVFVSVSDGRVVQQRIYWSLCAGCRLQDHAGLRGCRLVSGYCWYLCVFVCICVYFINYFKMNSSLFLL